MLGLQIKRSHCIIDSLASTASTHYEKFQKLEQHNADLRECLLALEIDKWKNNIKILGISDSQLETDEQLDMSVSSELQKAGVAIMTDVYRCYRGYVLS